MFLIFLFYINLTFAVLLLFAPIWWSVKYLDQKILNPVSISTIFFLPAELFRLFLGQLYVGSSSLSLSNLFDPGYQFAVLMTSLQQFIVLSMIGFSARLRVINSVANIVPRFGLYSLVDFRRFAKVFFLFYVLAFCILAIRTGGVLSWLDDIRGSYMEKRDGNGVFFAAAVSFLSISYFFEGIASTKTLPFTMRSFIYLCAVYILGSKGFVLQFIIFYIIIVLRIGLVDIGRALMIAMPMAFMLLLYNFTSQRETIDLSDFAEYFSHYPNAAMYYTDYFRGDISLFYGEVFLTSLWEYVPRSLFPEKPYVYGILNVVEIYYPGGAESGNTPSFYGGVPQFADFGVAGVLLFTFLNLTPIVYFSGLSYALKYRNFLKSEPMSGRTIVISLLLFAPAFGIFLPTAFLFMSVLSVIFILKLVKIIIRFFFLFP